MGNTVEHVQPPNPDFFSKTSMLQIAYGVWANLGTVCIGMTFGFTAVAVPQMRNDRSITISDDDLAWFVSVISLSAISGCLITGYITDKLGRKYSLILNQVPMITSWIIHGLATSRITLLIGRILAGVAVGMTSGPTRIYCSEISLPNMRGVLGSLHNVCLAVGIVTQAIMGAHLNWREICFINAGFSTVVLCFNFWLPETPYYLLLKHHNPEFAKRCLKRFRGKNYDVDAEMDMLEDFKHQNHIIKLTCPETLVALFQPSSCKPFITLMILMILVQFSGISIITFWTVEALVDSRLSLDANLGNVVISSTRTAGSILCAFIIYKLPRRIMLIISGTGMALCLICLGMHILLSPSPNVLPIICCCSYVLFGAVGYQIVPFLMVSELYPLQVRGTLSGLTTAFVNLLLFIMNWSYPLIKKSVGSAYTFFIYSAFSFIGSLYVYCIVPETKDLTLQEIEEHYNEMRPTRPARMIVRAQQLQRDLQQKKRFLDYRKMFTRKKPSL